MTDLNTIKEFTEALRATESGTKPYDTSAEVVRVDGSTAWVHIPGGVDETPVQLSIDAKPGDSVNVRVSGGRAWITGNGSRPPTDDTRANVAHHTANIAQMTAEEAQETAEAAQAAAQATRNYFWHDARGAHVATVEGNATSGKNVLLDSDGLAIRYGANELAYFHSNEIGLGEEAGTIKFCNDNFRIETMPNVPPCSYVTLGPGEENGYPLAIEIITDDMTEATCVSIELVDGKSGGGIPPLNPPPYGTRDYVRIKAKNIALNIGENVYVNNYESINASGQALQAISDGHGNNIVDTYMPQTNGAITDLNNAGTNGIYTYASTASNIPTSSGGCLLVMRYSSNYTHQLAMPNNSNGTSRLYTRIKTSSGWGAWTEK